MLTLYHGNRLENLGHQLNQVLRKPLCSALSPELIVVQSQGMARWISMETARYRGISANLVFPFPGKTIWDLLRTQIPDAPESSPFEAESLTWKLFALLPDMLRQPGFEVLAHYLKRESSDTFLFQLARQIATVFGQYLIYRPHLILRWEDGAEQHWQALLWRVLVGLDPYTGRASAHYAPPLHRARLLRRFVDLCDRGEVNGAALPERFNVFGISSMPPGYLEVLARVSLHVDVHLFVLTPCLAYWGDILPQRDQAKIRAMRRRLHVDKGSTGGRKQGGFSSDGEDYFNIGNPLLASLGKLGRDFQEQLHLYDALDHDFFEEPEGDSLLRLIQSDILNLHHRRKDFAGSQKTSIPAGDRSLQFHACHGPMRELEVLHDQLLALLEQDPSLEPRDILVMTPDMDAYAPYVEAVFGAAPASRRIPWSVTDRTHRDDHPLLQAFLGLIDLAPGRLALSQVLVFLDQPAVARRFSLNEAALGNIRRWAAESGIRWGLDQEARRDLDLPATHQNTWRFGLERLLLGYALPPVDELCLGIRPLSAVEGSETVWLGRLCGFIERLATLRRQFSRKRTPQQWVALLNQAMDHFFAPSQDETEALGLIQQAMDGFLAQTAAADFNQPMALQLVREVLTGKLSEAGGARRFLSGRISFGAMVPMRSIPFRVLCLIGMNDGAFPRFQTSPGFDLIAREPMLGDRSRREDDRYLFLEALISARDCFYISYVGRDARDNSPKLPSVLVTELQDYVHDGFEGDFQETGDGTLLVEHYLQPFNPAYFRDSSIHFSYASEWLVTRDGNPRNRSPFFVGKLPKKEREQNEISLQQLVRFFKNPAQNFLNERLNVWLHAEESPPMDEEPFTLDGLQRYQLNHHLLEQMLKGEKPRQNLALIQASGALPMGGFGELALLAGSDDLRRFSAKLAPKLDDLMEPLEVRLEVGGRLLTGWLRNITPRGLISYRFAPISAKDNLELWIHHLVLNLLDLPGIRPASLHLGKRESCRFEALPQSAELLKRFIDLYGAGLNRPLPFFPETSLTFAKTALKKSPAEALGRARLKWEGADWVRGESQDPYFRTAFRDSTALDASFTELAQGIFLPLLEREKQDSDGF